MFAHLKPNHPNRLEESTLSKEERHHIDQMIDSALNNRRKVNAQDLAELIAIKSIKASANQNLKKLFMAIGFATSLLLVIAAFEWKTYETREQVDLNYSIDKFEELAEIPLTEQAPPPPPSTQTVQVIFTEVPDEEVIDEIKVDLDVEITSEMTVHSDLVNPFESEPEEEVADEIFTVVETYPKPVGGLAAFYQYVAENLEYPAPARRMGIEGRVFVQFVVEPDGAISQVEVVKGIDPSCDKAAVDAITDAPNWTPGKQRGRPVRVRMIVPIIFKLGK